MTAATGGVETAKALRTARTLCLVFSVCHLVLAATSYRGLDPGVAVLKSVGSVLTLTGAALVVWAASRSLGPGLVGRRTFVVALVCAVAGLVLTLGALLPIGHDGEPILLGETGASLAIVLMAGSVAVRRAGSPRTASR